jgi:hypothetical protein
VVLFTYTYLIGKHFSTAKTTFRNCFSFSKNPFFRMLLLAERGGDTWRRTDELMDHLGEKGVHPQALDFSKPNPEF